MYYSSGNYAAFARPEKPEGVDHKSAYLIGSGLAALSAACFMVRDGQMKGEHIHVLEKDPIPGGACDGYKYQDIGYVMRGGREMDNHFECMWDLFRSIPSIEDENVTVLDEYYWLNKHDPNYSLCRATVNCGEDAHTDGKFGLSDKGAMEILKLFMTPDEQLYDKKITDFFDDEVLNTNFWLYWRTMFAFENWHSALDASTAAISRFISSFSLFLSTAAISGFVSSFSLFLSTAAVSVFVLLTSDDFASLSVISDFTAFLAVLLSFAAS